MANVRESGAQQLLQSQGSQVVVFNPGEAHRRRRRLTSATRRYVSGAIWLRYRLRHCTPHAGSRELLVGLATSEEPAVVAHCLAFFNPSKAQEPGAVALRAAAASALGEDVRKQLVEVRRGSCP